MEKVCDMLIERVHELEKEDAALRWVGGCWAGVGPRACRSPQHSQEGAVLSDSSPTALP